jgi:hypothetical protein
MVAVILNLILPKESGNGLVVNEEGDGPDVESQEERKQSP